MILFFFMEIVLLIFPIHHTTQFEFKCGFRVKSFFPKNGFDWRPKISSASHNIQTRLWHGLCQQRLNAGVTNVKSVSEQQLKDRLTDYFRELEATGEEVCVTKDGRLVLKLISYNRYFGGYFGEGNDQRTKK